jgi:transposase
MIGFQEVSFMSSILQKEVFIIGVDVSKNSFTATVLYDNKKENLEVKSDPVEFEMKLKPYLKKFKQSDMLIIMEHTGAFKAY